MGNKNDDPSKKQVDSQDAQRFGESVGVRVFETSAKENINVEEVSWFLQLSCPQENLSFSDLPVSCFILTVLRGGLADVHKYFFPPELTIAFQKTIF